MYDMYTHMRAPTHARTHAHAYIYIYIYIYIRSHLYFSVPKPFCILDKTDTNNRAMVYYCFKINKNRDLSDVYQICLMFTRSSRLECSQTFRGAQELGSYWNNRKGLTKVAIPVYISPVSGMFRRRKSRFCVFAAISNSEIINTEYPRMKLSLSVRNYLKYTGHWYSTASSTSDQALSTLDILIWCFFAFTTKLHEL